MDNMAQSILAFEQQQKYRIVSEDRLLRLEALRLASHKDYHEGQVLDRAHKFYEFLKGN
jgi:hypothetical protein